MTASIHTNNVINNNGDKKKRFFFFFEGNRNCLFNYYSNISRRLNGYGININSMWLDSSCWPKMAIIWRPFPAGTVWMLVVFKSKIATIKIPYIVCRSSMCVGDIHRNNGKGRKLVRELLHRIKTTPFSHTENLVLCYLLNAMQTTAEWRGR